MSARKLSPIAAILATRGKWRRYLLGYVVGVEYGKEAGEWLLTRAGHLSATHPRDKAEGAHAWPTKAEALTLARKVAATYRGPGFGRLYVRPYAYETPNPASAKGLAPLDTAEPLEYVTEGRVAA